MGIACQFCVQGYLKSPYKKWITSNWEISTRGLLKFPLKIFTLTPHALKFGKFWETSLRYFPNMVSIQLYFFTFEINSNFPKSTKLHYLLFYQIHYFSWNPLYFSYEIHYLLDVEDRIHYKHGLTLKIENILDKPPNVEISLKIS